MDRPEHACVEGLVRAELAQREEQALVGRPTRRERGMNLAEDDIRRLACAPPRERRLHRIAVRAAVPEELDHFEPTRRHDGPLRLERRTELEALLGLAAGTRRCGAGAGGQRPSRDETAQHSAGARIESCAHVARLGTPVRSSISQPKSATGRNESEAVARPSATGVAFDEDQSSAQRALKQRLGGSMLDCDAIAHRHQERTQPGESA